MAFGTSPYGIGDGGGGGDITPPTIAYDPPAGTPIRRDQTIKVTITDTGGLQFFPVMARYPSGAYEVVHDGVAFAAFYAGSTIQAVAGGFLLTLQRVGGWPAAPTIRTSAVDTSGNET
jgi:hypothetical protein